MIKTGNSISRYFMFFILAFFLSVSVSNGQRTGLDLLGSKETIEIPFTESNGLLMINLKMNGVPLTFMYDTGAENTILFKKEIAIILGLESTRRIRIIGSDLSNTIYGFIVHNVKFKIRPGVERIESMIVLEDNVYKIQESTGHQIDGLLGGNFFRNTVVKIDYRKDKLIISHPLKVLPNLEEYTEIPAFFKDQKPYVKARISTYENQWKDILLLMDTGSSIPFILHTNVDSSLRVPDNVIRGNLGIGLSGTLIGLIGIIRLLEYGPFEFRGLLTNFQELDESIMSQKEIWRHGILGNDILRRFTVIVDYFNRKIYMKPGKRYNESFKYDKSGLVIIASGMDFNEYYIQAVIEESPAEEAGLLKGDKLISLQRIPASFRSLMNIQNYFKKRAGTTIRLKVLRGDEKLVYRFELKDMLKSPLSGITNIKHEWVVE